jgi:hypothetical protein
LADGSVCENGKGRSEEGEDGESCKASEEECGEEKEEVD